MKPFFSTLVSCRLTHGSLLVLAYFAAGKLSLLLAIPPGYASPIWPAAGIALYGILLSGYRVWPAIVVGSFLLNIPPTLATTEHFNVTLLMLPTGIGIGAAFHACFGAFLIKRYSCFPTPSDKIEDLFKTMFLGGPLSCLISATMGSLLLMSFGMIQWSQLPENWLTWWIGDTIGVLMTIAFFSAWAREMNQVGLKKRLIISLPIITLFVLVITGFLYIRNGEWHQSRLAFEKKTIHISKELHSHLQYYIEDLYSLGAFFDASQEVERHEFHIYTQQLIARHPGIQALEWVPRITLAKKNAFENAIQQQLGHAFFRITEKSPAGEVTPASLRPVYFPVSYVEPFAGNEKALGFDLGSNPERQATMHQALLNKKPTASPGITLIQETQKQLGVLIFHPVFSHTRGLSTPPNDTPLLGYALGVFRLSDIVREALQDFDKSGIEYCLHDVTSTAQNQLLYASQACHANTPPSQLQWSTTLTVGERIWGLNFHTTSQYFMGQHHWLAYTFLTGGLFFTSLFGAYIIMFTGRAKRTQQIVSERTAELTETKESLEQEIHERKQMEMALREAQHDLEQKVIQRTSELQSMNLELQKQITQHRQLSQELSKSNRALKALTACNFILVHAEDEHELLEKTCQCLVSVGDYLLAWVGFAQNDVEKSVLPVAQAGYGEGYINSIDISWHDTATGRGPVGTAIRTGETAIIHDVSTNTSFSPWRDDARKRGYQSVIALPLKTEQDVLGSLAIYAKERNSFDSEEVKLLEELAANLIYGIMALRNNIDRKETEQKLQESESLFRSLVELAPDAILIVDQNNTIRLTNKQAENLFGYQQNELQGQPHSILLPKSHITLHTAHHKNYFKNPVPRPMGVGKELYGKKKDDTEFPVEISLSPIHIGGEKQVISIIRDITERKKAEDSLRGSLKELVTLNESSSAINASLSLERVAQAAIHAIISLISPDMIIFYIKDDTQLRQQDFYSLNPKDIRKNGHTHLVGDCLCGEAAETGNAVYSLDINTDTRCSMTECKQAGYLSFAAIPLIFNEHILGVIGLGSGTERDFQKQATFLETLANQIAIGVQNALFYEALQHQAEQLEIRVIERTKDMHLAMKQALESDQLKSAFLATMSHELRTPLNSIIGFTGILLMGLTGDLNDEQKKQLNMVKQSASHLLNLINDILDISKIEAGQLEVSLELFSMPETIHKVVETLTPMARAKGLLLTVEIARDVQHIKSDKRRVEQILINLLNNAVKFTQTGTITVLCHTQGPVLVTSVEDTGIGIKPEDMAILFTAFRQIETGLDRKHEGTGLGLSICKKLIDLLHGTIQAESKGPDQGSTFTFTLPLENTKGS